MSGYDVIVIGAGAAGLMAALQLAKAGKKVQVLEARNRLGGRICTVPDAAQNGVIELGAEFVHGNLAETQALLKEAGLEYYEVSGEMRRMKKGKLVQEDFFIPDWPLLVQQLQQLKEDITLEQFLQQYFPDEKYAELRRTVENYAAGYDNADPAIASVFALRDEWLEEEEAPQYRIRKGYGSMIAYMAESITALGSQIIVDARVKEIHWQTGKVVVVTEEGSFYTASKVLITLPLGILQAPAIQASAISFYPAAGAAQQAIQQLGMGVVIKLILEFNAGYYTQLLHNNGLQHMQFLFSEEAIDTWWTQVPDNRPVLTGWLGGYKAQKQMNTSKEELLQLSLQSLSAVFKVPVEELRSQLLVFHALNWATDTYTQGSYSYATVATSAALETIQESGGNTLFWAGEAFYQGPACGTVEAALVSGKQAAGRLLV